MENNMIKAPKGAVKSKRKIGRGPGSGAGKTSGRGHKGQNSRSGGNVRPGFEGGQMPLYRRIARRGFSNYPFKKEFIAINLNEINSKYNDGEIISLESLKEKRIIKNKDKYVKILGNGEVTKKLVVKLDRISKSAQEKIEKAGGKIENIEE